MGGGRDGWLGRGGGGWSFCGGGGGGSLGGELDEGGFEVPGTSMARMRSSLVSTSSI